MSPLSPPFCSFIFVLSILLIHSYLLIFVNGQDASDACVNTQNKCHCAPTTPSGTCTRPKSSGNCLLEPCNIGYRCDCHGYEMCNVEKCGKYFARPDETASETVPFQCELRPESADCIKKSDVLDTETAAKHAEVEASAGNMDATATEVFIGNTLDEAQTQKKIMNQMLSDVERVAIGLNETELDEIARKAEVVENSIQEVAGYMTEATEASSKCFNFLVDVRGLKRTAFVHGRRARLLRKELAMEEEKAVRDEEKVQKLQDEITGQEDNRRKAARSCGQKAIELRQWRKKVSENMDMCNKSRSRGQKAFNSCLELCKAALTKVSAAAGSLPA